MTKVEHSLFEDGFLVSSIGQIAQKPEVAIAELVANAWDAGASRVEIDLPANLGELITVADDGVGLTPQQFRERWMRLGYKRVKHQGEFAEFPPSRSTWRRRAYGRNGAGRHGMLCFAAEYKVLSKRYDSDEAHEFIVAPASGENAFQLLSDVVAEREVHGTTVSAKLEYALPKADEIYQSLSFKFLHDPNFNIFLNGEAINVESHPIVAETTLKVNDETTVHIRCIKVPPGKKTHIKHGVAFWVGGKLVGDPIYSLQEVAILDGRSTASNRHLIVVTTDDLFDEVLPDWTGFKRSNRVVAVAEAIAGYMNSIMSELMSEKIEETKTEALRESGEAIKKLRPLAQVEITQFVNDIIDEHPMLRADVLKSAVKAAVNLEKSRSGQALLEKLATMSMDDIELIDKLLENWTVRDALVVLEEIDRRMVVVEALQKLMNDSSADELHSIHPLVSQARWLFGPEYESPEFASNITIRQAAEKVFKRKVDPTGIFNPRQRPDLIFCKDATYSLTAIERFQDEVVVLSNLLVIELKKGNFRITSKQMFQAQQYVLDLLGCDLLDGAPYITAFVVGHTVDAQLEAFTVGQDPIKGIVRPVTFGQLIRTAKQRLFKLQEYISERYKNIPGMDLVDKLLGVTGQRTLDGEFEVTPAKVKKGKKGAAGRKRA
jgi:hypothetical protein